MATTITMAEFQVDLSAMKAAIDQLKTLSGKVEDDLNRHIREVQRGER